MKSLQHIVTQREANIRLDKLLVSLQTDYSRQQIQQWIKDAYVTVNGSAVKANYKCKLGDRIEWAIPEIRQMTIKPEPLPLTIVYEDEYWLVVIEPKGMLVHLTETVRTGSLVHGIKHYTSQLSSLSGPERPGIVHLLDQYTSGLIIVCKDDDTHAHLKQQFKQHTVKRIYEAIVYGHVAHRKGVIKALIGRDPQNRLKMSVISTGKYAETHFEVIDYVENYTYVTCQLITGRTHQIRVHMKYLGHPIVGDPLYSEHRDSNYKQQLLFAKTLGFTHPYTSEYVQFSVERPKEFIHILNESNN